ncbi:MAG: complex I subunit 1 family protein [Candidatus Parvarchaeota archaeon]
MALSLDFILHILLFPGFSFILTLTLICDWIERKIEARIQNRMGPTYTGPAGILQPIADFIKLLSKEDIVPIGARKFLFLSSGVLAVSIFIFTFLFLPINSRFGVFEWSFEGDLILVLAMISVANFFLFISGWASNNPYGVIGANRILIQLLGYDIPLFFLALAPAFLAGSLSLSEIASRQRIPFALIIPWAFILFIIALQAELEKDPFDIPHAETEVVGGYETEYSGKKLAFLKLAKDVQILLGAALTVELFLGGPYGPVLYGPPAIWYTLWFVIKLFVVVVISEYLACIFARLRIDQVVAGNWRVILPASLMSLLLAVIIRCWLFPTV